MSVNASDILKELQEENQQLAQDKENAILLMSPSWKHAAGKESDILTRFVTMANEQFEIRDKLKQDKAELVKTLRELVATSEGNEAQLNDLLGEGNYGESKALCDAREILTKHK